MSGCRRLGLRLPSAGDGRLTTHLASILILDGVHHRADAAELLELLVLLRELLPHTLEGSLAREPLVVQAHCQPDQLAGVTVPLAESRDGPLVLLELGDTACRLLEFCNTGLEHGVRRLEKTRELIVALDERLESPPCLLEGLFDGSH